MVRALRILAVRVLKHVVLEREERGKRDPDNFKSYLYFFIEKNLIP